MKNIEENILIKEMNSNGVLKLILNDDKNKNALSELMIMKLITDIDEAAADDEVKIIVIASLGNVFCSGHNLKEITNARKSDDKGQKYFKNLFNSCSSLMQMIVNCPKPVIAEVNGIATAAGCQLVASCDLAFASDISRFATPGVNIGLFCSTPMVALSRNVNKKHAMKMLLTGDMIDAVEAKRISLINDFYQEKDLSKAVMALAEKIASKPMMTLNNGKQAFYKQYEMHLIDAYNYTSKVMANNALKDDAKEGIASFLEKRKPNWRNKS